jgi:hypothetical protein
MALPADAAPGRTGPLSRLLSFPALLVVALGLLVGLTCRGRFSDPDTWWHLKVGEIIWQTHSLPRTDTLSYTTHQHAWIPHEWLAEISIYAAYRLGGYQGLWLWQWGLASLVVILVYALCAWHAGNAKVALIGGMAAWFFSTISLATRPLLLGYLFLVAELLLIHLGRTRDRRWLWGLPPLFALWVNCHGSHVLGLAVLGMYTACSWVDLRAGLLVSERRAPQERRAFAAVLAASVAALFVNPVGPQLVFYPFNVLAGQPVNVGNVAEWASLNFQEARGIGLFLVVGLIALLVLARRATVRLEEALLLAGATLLAVRHSRLVFGFGILAAPLLTRLLAEAWGAPRASREHPVANGFLMAAAAAIFAVSFPSTPELQRQAAQANPQGAVEFVRKAGLTGPMMNEYVWGGYLTWALPEHRVFIDGRADVFEWTGVLAEYGRWYTLQEDPQKLLGKYGIQFCLLRPEAPQAQVLPYLTGWRRAYRDERAVVFVRDKEVH